MMRKNVRPFPAVSVFSCFMFLFLFFGTTESRAANPDGHITAWVFLTDKGALEGLRRSVPEDVVSDRSIRRRLKVRSADQVVDYSDLPVDETYVSRIRERVLRVRQRSKWFNAVSVVASRAQLAGLLELPFVRSIEPVARFRRNNPGFRAHQGEARRGHATVLTLDYGESYVQDSLINVPAVHATGNYGQGVIVGMFDNGVRLPEHEAFDSLNIIATHDFVDHKESVVPNNPVFSFGSYGVYTLSAIGGNKPGLLIGPAFGASYILARTENDSSETPIEEDNWVAAMEWADSIGVDVTSTSLGYFSYDPPYESWTWEDMNGNTTVITRAADMAVARGIVVVNSAGNAGGDPTHNTLVAPSDGDSVLAIGAVISTGERANFSSVGPTTSNPPRIKPDVMAQGVNVFVASGINPDGYGGVSGTSLSCPLAAGVAALIIHDRPTATPVEIADAMRNTSSNAGSPNNEYGWGILDALAAIQYLTPTGAGQGPSLPAEFRLDQNFPNPFNPSTQISFEVAGEGVVSLRVYDLLGREVATLANERLSSGAHVRTWDAAGQSGGVYFYRLRSGNSVETRKMILMK